MSLWRQSEWGLSALQREPLRPPPLLSHLGLAAGPGKTTAGITSPRCWIKSSLYPQKSRINMKNVNVCSERGREKKDILKYTFIQSLRKIKQQNWSALPSALLPPSPQLLASMRIDFLLGPSPWRLQLGPRSPLFRPKSWLLWDTEWL